MSSQVVVIGGGLSGLATAALLGKAGYQVTLIEQNQTLGGRARSLNTNGFTFDMGPSWYHMPEAFDHFFALFGKSPHDYYELIHLNPQYRAFFSDASYQTITPDIDATYQLFDRLDPGSSDRLKKFLTKAKQQYELSRDLILYRSFASARDLLSPDLMLHGHKFAVLGSLSRAVERVTSHPHLQKILMFTILFLGGQPKHTPALFSLMTYLDLGVGAYYPLGGIGSVVQGLARLCREQGVSISTGTEVTSIVVEHGKTTGVTTATGTIRADLVVATGDYPDTECRLLPQQYQSYPESYWKRRSLAPSAFVMYLGIKGSLQRLTHHSLFLEDDWDEFFDQVFHGSQFPTNPSFYASCISKTDPSMAPEGHENLFITIQTSHQVADTPELREQYASFIIQRLEERIQEPFADRVVFKQIFARDDFITDYHAYQGSAIGLENTINQSAALRPSHRSKKVSNLFYAGQYTHPGVGLPMCLISAELVAKQIAATIPC